MLLTWLMVLLFSLFGKRSTMTNGMSPTSLSTSSSKQPARAEVEDRLRGALWGVSINAGSTLFFGQMNEWHEMHKCTNEQNND